MGDLLVSINKKRRDSAAAKSAFLEIGRVKNLLYIQANMPFQAFRCKYLKRKEKKVVTEISIGTD